MPWQCCRLHCNTSLTTHAGCMQDKILQSMGRSQDVMVTNDGATILKSLYVDNPAAKVLVGNQHCMLQVK